MKTSDKLLLFSLIVCLLTLVGSTVALKAEHDKIDFNDPFYGFVTTPIKPFKVLKIDGGTIGASPTGIFPSGSAGGPQPTNDSYTSVGIQAGKTVEIRTRQDANIRFTHRMIGDTLLIQYEPEFYPRRISADEAFETTPFLYVIAPSIQGLIATKTTCKLAGLTTDNLAISATNARVCLDNSSINSLIATGQSGSLLQTAATNHIRRATITSRDSTGFVAVRDVFGSLSLQNDSTAVVKVPAALLKKLL